MLDDYSDNIDWDLVYRAFHNPKAIADNIHCIVGSIDSPLVFCGFPEVASLLSAHYQILFVDSSKSIVANTRLRYPHIDTVIESEISGFLQSNPVKHVVISGRLSAFWQSEKSFDDIAQALNAYPRSLILIDYFDQESVYPGLHTRFSAPTGEGFWVYGESECINSDTIEIHNVDLEISYKLELLVFSYKTRRAYFNRSDIEAWHKGMFQDSQTTVIPGLLEDDPSFSVKTVSTCE